jgi:hypothetical protein
MWRGHEIKGKNTYLMPWKQITIFANAIIKTIIKRFPSEEFLQALDIIVPGEWTKARDTTSWASMWYNIWNHMLTLRMEAPS